MANPVSFLTDVIVSVFFQHMALETPKLLVRLYEIRQESAKAGDAAANAAIATFIGYVSSIVVFYIFSWRYEYGHGRLKEFPSHGELLTECTRLWQEHKVKWCAGFRSGVPRSLLRNRKGIKIIIGDLIRGLCTPEELEKVKQEQEMNQLVSRLLIIASFCQLLTTGNSTTDS